MRLYNRNGWSSGIGQHLDTRCLHRSLNEFYEIHLYFCLEENNSTFTCDPFSSSDDDRCPWITFKTQRYVNGELDTSYNGRRADVVVPNSDGDFDLVHGVFKVDEILQGVQRL